MVFFGNLKPRFWDHVDVSHKHLKYMFNFRKMWKSTLFLTMTVALLPLLVLGIVDYRVTEAAIESEILLRTGRLVSNTQHGISFFLTERKAALDYVILSDSFEHLKDPEYLQTVLQNLKQGFGGFVDLGVIDEQGVQINYIGPHQLLGQIYSDAEWFRAVSKDGVFISDVFKGFRNVPHMVIAVKHRLPNDRFYVLRATLDTERFNYLLSGMELEDQADAFVINHYGILQTPSRYYGHVLEYVDLPVLEQSEGGEVKEVVGKNGSPLIMGYSYIPQTPFILIVCKNKPQLLAPWNHRRLELAGFMTVSVITIVLVVLGGITYLVNQIYDADQRRLMVMHKVEYSNKMASLGRLSAAVAHEINNPLAVINEKAGLIKDLLSFKKEYTGDPKLMRLIDGVISSVQHCSDITHRLLNFARHSQMKNKPIDLKMIIDEVLGFMTKEAEYRSIRVKLDIAEDIQGFKSDPGVLQEVFLNLLTNAFAAVNDGGSIEITGRLTPSQRVAVEISDNGHGIPEQDLDRVFEPFFSTKIGKGGTGLGLSITYGLIDDLGGSITVKSKVGEGTTFAVTVPLSPLPIEESSREPGR